MSTWKADIVSKTPKGIRYATPEGPEAEFQPGSKGEVLLNLKGITRKNEIERLEYSELVRVQEEYLQTVESSTRITVPFICKMHKDWLGSIYEWAGRYRTVELAKAGFQWPPAYLVEKNIKDFEASLLKEHTPCKAGPVADVAMSIAKVHAELLLIHPFREGNGRLARWLADIMALQGGFPVPEYGFVGKGAAIRQKRYLDGVKRGYIRDYQPLADFFAGTITRGRV